MYNVLICLEYLNIIYKTYLQNHDTSGYSKDKRQYYETICLFTDVIKKEPDHFNNNKKILCSFKLQSLSCQVSYLCHHFRLENVFGL